MLHSCCLVFIPWYLLLFKIPLSLSAAPAAVVELALLPILGNMLLVLRSVLRVGTIPWWPLESYC